MKVKGILAYIFTWLGGLIVYFTAKENEGSVKFHAAQAIVLGIISVASSVICMFIPFVGDLLSCVINVAVFVFVVWGIIKVATDDKNAELPVIGNLAHSIFKI